MAITKILARKARLDVGINYVLNGDKTEDHVLTATLNCDPGREYRQMMDTKQAVGKTNGVQYYHITLLEQTAEQDDTTTSIEHFQSITQEIAALKEQRTQIENLCQNSSASFQRMNIAASILQSTSPALREWDETVIRQLVDTVKVLSAETIVVYLYGGIEVEQNLAE